MKYLLLALFLSINCLAEEKRIRVAIIDTGIANNELENYLCKDGHKDFTNTSLVDTETHGTAIASIIASHINPRKVCIVIVKYHEDKLIPRRLDKGILLAEAIEYAVDQGVTYINISSSGDYPIDRERKALERGLAQHVRIAVSAGNGGKNLSKSCQVFPACYPFRHYNYSVVGGVDAKGMVMPGSNFNGPVNQYALGVSLCTDNINTPYYRRCITGTSASTAEFLGKLIEKETK